MAVGRREAGMGRSHGRGAPVVRCRRRKDSGGRYGARNGLRRASRGVEPSVAAAESHPVRSPLWAGAFALSTAKLPGPANYIDWARSASTQNVPEQSTALSAIRTPGCGPVLSLQASGNRRSPTDGHPRLASARTVN